MKSKRFREQLYTILIGFAFAILVLLSDQLGAWSSVDARFGDNLLAKRNPQPDIAIVAIDNRSITELGVWPWPRSYHAKLIELLTTARARAIGYDVTFSEASTPAADAELVSAATGSGSRLVLAAEAVLKFPYNSLPTFSDLLEPIPALRVQTSEGITTLIPDGDGVVRRAPLVIQNGTTTKSSFATALFGAMGGDVTQLPSLDRGTYRIPYVGGPNTFPVYSFIDVLQGKVSIEMFNNKIVLVGATAPDLHDTHLTPFDTGTEMSGVEVQANILQGIREVRTLRKLSFVETALLYLGLFVFFSFVTFLARFRTSLVVAIVTAFFYIVVALLCSSFGILLPIIYPLVLIVGVTTIDVAGRYRSEQKRRRFIRGAFDRYLAPAVIEELLQGRTPLALGGKSMELTIFFSDIRGFTTLSESLSPEGLVTLLNEYLTEMTDIILASGGVVDKFIGDAIMAFWGAPIAQNDHVARAARAALRMQSRLLELREGWHKAGTPDIKVGMGINTGTVVIGNMGSRQRFDYTVMGDAVNLASRLEGLTKQYGVILIISRVSRDTLGDQFVVRPLDFVAVKGKKVPVEIFELIGERGATTPAIDSLIARFTQAIGAYRARRWIDAEKIFSELVQEYNDAPSKVFIERCHHLREHDPGETWDGAYVAKEK